MDKKLPVGSVIRVRNLTEKYIIIGKDIIENDITYDYMCCNYPYGLIPEKDCCFFQDKDVESLCFLGNIND